MSSGNFVSTQSCLSVFFFFLSFSLYTYCLLYSSSFLSVYCLSDFNIFAGIIVMSALDFIKIIQEQMKINNKEQKFDIFETKILSKEKEKKFAPLEAFLVFLLTFLKKKNLRIFRSVCFSSTFTKLEHLLNIDLKLLNKRATFFLFIILLILNK